MGLTKFVACGDNHGDLVDNRLANQLFAFCKEWKPKYKIHLGDNWDFRCIRKGASASEEHDLDIEDDWVAGQAFLESYKPTVFLWGNHDHRLMNMLDRNNKAVVRGYARQGIDRIEGILRKIGCKEVRPYHYDKGVYQLGPVSFVHGYSANLSSERQHASHYAISGGACIMGHVHRMGMDIGPRHGGVTGYSAGCLAEVERMTYASQRLATARWQPGWLFGMINEKTGGWQVWQANVDNGNVMIP